MSNKKDFHLEWNMDSHYQIEKEVRINFYASNMDEGESATICFNLTTKDSVIKGDQLHLNMDKDQAKIFIALAKLHFGI